jgi:uridine kinase
MAVNDSIHRAYSNQLYNAEMMVQFIEKKLFEKSTHHREALSRLEATCKEQALSDRVVILDDTPQLKFMNTILQDIDTSAEDFIFYFDRLAALLIEQYVHGNLVRAISDGRAKKEPFTGL